jgi:indolepyruvate ferredoxin oxidoreductase beta subunit
MHPGLQAESNYQRAGLRIIMNLQLIISGIGGQGVVFGTKVISQAALLKEFKVIGSETHGMAQRGGSVISYLKIGDFLNPLIRPGTADIIHAFDQTEFLRTLPFIKNGGVCFVNTNRDDLVTGEIAKHLKNANIRIFTLNADKIALELKTPLSVNLIMIGFSIPSNYLPFNQSDIEETISKITPKKFLDMNLKAFRAGYEKWRS